MNEMLKNKVAVVTGASRGVGLATARCLAEAGAHVVMCSRSEEDILGAAQSIPCHGSQKIIGIAADVSKKTDVERLFHSVNELFGTLDILINNAGYLAVTAFEDLDEAIWDQTINANLKSAYLCSHAAFPLMISNPTPTHIINVSSLSGIRFVEKFPGMAAYVAAKHGVTGLTEALSVEGKPHDIRVNCVAPGTVDTRMLNDNFPDFSTNTQPKDIAKIIIAFCDDNTFGVASGTTFEVMCND
ncbi:Enoyl-[acyl-carrier-protein] reductase [NADPH] FabL [BD1-7 clade bacterium]|uniref:Enoyl-[acyl-carrier-protein] reductase [NADPH] FabL n=1 Tax=BD1-7 clade bacterium TaxID=2029982 RepID=A0A5S9QUS6_9GAMM|nr:Enoyl-[acyl-carrier-protein] reductase [NADPH] FabL [BD1-7 clade bacterium]CAA0122788.1 Enoyl-[acyl-carrier-protein] reductase [NADPH] FabL [BD1-7 clade bacterium]